MRMRILSMSAIPLIALLMQFSALAGTADVDDQALQVTTKSGPVLGAWSADKAAKQWLGLPYAEPPVGDHRWEAPSPHAPWTSVLPTKTFGSPCPQFGSQYGPPPPGKTWGIGNVEIFGKMVGNEDCLTLNIWHPNNSEAQLPVLAFLHGGGNVFGSSADPIYDGAKLAVAANAVVVTLNYRLGLFGWLACSCMQGKDPLSNSGDFATLDIVAALKYVQANAAAFGGDANNLTLMGQSAGAIDAYQLIASQLSVGLFKKAILLSGLIQGVAGKDKGYAYANELSEQLVIHDALATTQQSASQYIAGKGPVWLKQYLKSKTAARIMEFLGLHAELRHAPLGIGDGVVLPVDVHQAFADGHFLHVPMIVGMTRDESKMLVDTALKGDAASRFAMMLNTQADQPPKLKISNLISPYLLPSFGPYLYNAYHSLFTTFLLHSVGNSIAKLTPYAPKVYVYRFDWDRGPEPWKTVFGASHASDLPFVFGNFSTSLFSMNYSTANQPGRIALSQAMMQAIAAFIRTGDPNNPTLNVEWTAFGSKDGSGKKLLLDATDQRAELSVQ
jgi:para-nitrobenzyl esterase